MDQYIEALKIREALGLMHDADAVELLNSIAGTFRAQQKFDEALVYHGRAETLARALDPAQPRILGQVLQGYAMTYLLTGEHSRAEQLARDSLELVSDAVNDHYSVYANSVHALAESLRRQYKLEESGRLQRELLKVQTERLGAQSPIVARTWNNLSHVMRASGKYDEAEHALLQALAIHDKDGNTFDRAITYHNLGGLQNEARQPAKALPYLQRAMELKQQIGGPRGAQLVSTLVEISAARRELGDIRSATAAFAQAESIARESIPPADKRNVQVSLESARLSLARKDSAAAVTAARAALALIDEQDPGRMSMIQCVLAEALAGIGTVDEARELLNDALATRRRTMPAEHWMIAATERQLQALAD